MYPNDVMKNVKKNRGPLALVGAFVAIFLWSVAGQTSATDQHAAEPTDLVIGFHKRNDIARTYFSDLADMLGILNYLFLNAPAPAPPGPSNCGADPSANDAFTQCAYEAALCP